ncbi:MAG: hypothetical protein ABI333_09265 [bacterium]
MPEDLWSAAVAFAKTHGVYLTAKALTVGYATLKKRVGQQSTRRGAGGPGSTGFVELHGTQLMCSGSETGAVVEVLRSDGAKLSIRLPAGEVLDAVELAAAFWSGGE